MYLSVLLVSAIFASSPMFMPRGEEVMGCGGYVQSDVEINFSVIEVKLYSKQGSLKYSVDPAPNSGYYMVPVYDKGDYIIKVEPPPGWSFEPNQYSLHIDGTTDECTLQKDLNFRFRGFGITGKVVSAGSKQGPSGVTLAVTKPDSDIAIKTVTSQSGGNYVFSDLLPGRYIITASHLTWKFSVDSTPVTVGTETGVSERNIVLKGYDVKGSVSSEGDAVQGAVFVLIGDDSQAATDCTPGTPSGFTNKKVKAICHVSSGADGSFTFPSVAPGKYSIIPFYKGEELVFDVAPSSVEFSVTHNTHVIKERFEVTGFSVTGRVVEADESKGVGGVDVTFNGRKVAVTRDDGSFSVDSIKTGSYSITGSVARRRLEQVSVKISPSQPRLPLLKVASYEVCGQLSIAKPPAGVSSDPRGRSISISGQADVKVPKSDGKFCSYLAPGNYQFSPVISRSEQDLGLSLAPVQREVRVVNAPIDGIVFSQFRAQLHGSVVCIEPCPTLTVQMHPADKPDQISSAKTVQVPPLAGHFRFNDVLPGKYRLNVVHDSWCWQHKTVDIDVIDRDLSPENLFFMHEGYLLVASMSHTANVKFLIGDRQIKEFELNRGVNRYCLPEQGVYKVTPHSCFKFEQDVYTFDAARPSQLRISAVSQQLKGSVLSSAKADDIHITISSSKDSKNTVGPLKLQNENYGVFEYGFEFPVRLSETWRIEATSDLLLFSPSTVKVTPDPMVCPFVVEPIKARAGKFLSGTIKPALSGVKVVINEADGDKPQAELETNANGTYRAGPLIPELEYTVSAVLDGYVIVPDKQELGNFLAYKLGEIIVNVRDTAGQILDGVLLSVSGAERYRSNQQTEPNVPLRFLNLQPGDYFIRPMMKEYKFEPSSAMLHVGEGGTESIDFSAVRVAYSCYGSVTSLTGEPEPGVVLEARGAADSPCSDQEEESKTEVDGKFRIRGLQPSCTYHVTIKATDVNNHIERVTPSHVKVQVENNDVTGVRLFAFRNMAQVDVSGFVTADAEFINSLKVQLCREDSPTVPLHTFNLNPTTTYFYFPPLPTDSQRYLVRLESTLPRSLYEYTLPEVSFSAEKYFHFFKFKFEAKRRSIEHELGPGSYATVPVTLLLLLAIYHYNSILPAITSGVLTITAAIKGSREKRAESPSPSPDIPTLDTPKRKPKTRRA